jgi:hypothetical protein
MFDFFKKRREGKLDLEFTLLMRLEFANLLGPDSDTILEKLLPQYLEGVVNSIPQWRKSGRSIYEVAAELACIMITEQFERLSEASRIELLNSLYNKSDYLGQNQTLLSISLFYLERIKVLNNDELLAGDLHEMYVDEIVGALQGDDRDSRREHRIYNVLKSVGTESGWFCTSHHDQDLRIYDKSSDSLNYKLVCAICSNRYLREVNAEQLDGFRHLYPNIPIRVIN